MTAETPSRRRVSLFHLALVVPWVALVIDAFDPIVDNSFLWHVRAGTLQAEAGQVLTADPFSLALEGREWITQSWLAELFYGWAETAFGIGFAAPLTLAVGVFVIIGIGLMSYRRSGSVTGTGLVMILSTLLFLRFLVPRPVLFSYLLLVLVILAWDKKSTRWALPLLFWMWAGIHASFVIGLMFLALAALSRREWKEWPLIGVSGLVTLFTAHGWGVVTMLVDFAESREYLRLISEWRTPNFLELPLLPVLIGLVLIIYGAIKGRLETDALWVVVPFLALTFSSTRAVATGWIVLVPFVAAALTGLPVRRLTGYPVTVAAAIVVLIAVVPFGFTEGVGVDEGRFPLTAAPTLEDVPTFHDDVVGGYLIWSRDVSRVYVDDRVELYGERIQELVDVQAGRVEWESVFARDGITQALLRADQPLAKDIENAGWVVRHRDESFVVLLAP